MLTALAHVIHRRRAAFLGAGAAVMALAAVAAFGVGGGLFAKAAGGGFENTGSESFQAGELADERLGRTDYDVVVTYTDPAGDIAALSGEVSRTLAGVVDRAGVSEVVDPFAVPDPRGEGLVSEDGATAVALIRLVDDGDYGEDLASALVAPAPIETLRGGLYPVDEEISSQVGADLALAEGVMVPIVLVLLVVFMGGLVAGSLPLAIGGVAIVGAFGAMSLLAEVTDVSIFSVNVITALGLGLAVDYGLLLTARFREELTPGRDVGEALAVTMATAGRTVLVSGLTVAISLTAMLFFPFMFVRSMGAGAIAATVLAVVSALTVLPALLSLLGRGVDRWALPFRRGVRAGGDGTSGAWARLARAVMRRPGVVALAVLTLLAVLSAPVLDLRLGGVDTRVLPERAESRQAQEVLEEQFPALTGETVDVLAVSEGDSFRPGALEDLGFEITTVAGVAPQVRAASEDAVLLAVPLPDDDAFSTQARDLVRDLRALDVEGTDTLVSGQTARFIDQVDGIADRLPWAVAFVVVAELLLLFWAFGSILLPIKATLLNIVTITATFGVLVWAFGAGNLEGVLNFTTTGYLDISQLVVIVAIAFGLSMDYEVFLLSRVREEWDATGDNAQAVERGLQRTGGIVTAAALLLGLVVGGFMLGDVTFIQMVGLGLAFALLLDATVIRGLLVPATMRLLGRANWWAPAPLARWWDRHGLRENESPAASPATARQTGELGVPAG